MDFLGLLTADYMVKVPALRPQERPYQHTGEQDDDISWSVGNGGFGRISPSFRVIVAGVFRRGIRSLLPRTPRIWQWLRLLSQHNGLLDSGYWFFVSFRRFWKCFTHFLSEKCPLYLFLVHLDSTSSSPSCLAVDASTLSARLDSGYMFFRQFFEAVVVFTHFLREGQLVHEATFVLECLCFTQT